MSTQVEIINPVDGSHMKWLKNKFTESNRAGLSIGMVQKALSLELVLEMGKGYLDIGAHMGDFGIPMAAALKRVGRQDITVYCIEPDEGKCDFMREVIKINDLGDDSIKVINKGLSDKIGKFSPSPLVMRDCGNSTGGWQYITDPDGIEFTTLDQLWEEGVIGSVGLFNLDAQWAEPQILMGGKKYLTTYRPLILMEYWKVTSRLADNCVNTAVPGYPNTRGWNPSFQLRAEQLQNDDDFRDVFNQLGIMVSERKYNTEKITPFGEHSWKEWDILLEFNKKG